MFLVEYFHGFVFGFVYIGNLLTQRFFVDHGNCGASVEDILIVNQIPKEASIWSDLGPANRVNRKL